MFVSKPSYYDHFRCIAGSCPDSCCKEWSVQVDPQSAAYYRSLPGPLGDRLRQVLVQKDGETVMTIENNRCPMWRDDGLCRIQAELGEAALCSTCREFPRLRHDYGDFLELGLELSCPEAARMILSTSSSEPVIQQVPGGEEPEYDREAMDVLLRTRKTVSSILTDTAYPVPVSLALALLYGCQAQAELDGAQALPFDAEAALEEAAQLASEAEPHSLSDFFLELEILTDLWRQRLAAPAPGKWQEAYRNLARYFADRYWLQAVSDYDLYSRVKLIIISCLLIHQLGGDLIQTAQLYSKEIENNIDNVEAILDAAYTHPAFTDARLLGLLMKA